MLFSGFVLVNTLCEEGRFQGLYWMRYLVEKLRLRFGFCISLSKMKK